MRSRSRHARTRIVASAATLLLAIVASAQDSQFAPPVKPGEKAGILFAATAPGSPTGQDGRPALASLDPIAFLVGGELRGCYKPTPAANEDPIPQTTLDTLDQAYKTGHTYPLWWGGAPWGKSTSVKSCIDPDLDLNGCVRILPNDSRTRIPTKFNGTVVTYTPPAPTHPSLRARASADERLLFL